jgi:integrase
VVALVQNERSKQKDRQPVKGHPGLYYRVLKDGSRRYTFPYIDPSTGRQRWETVEGGRQDALDARYKLKSKLRNGEPVRTVDNRRLTFREAAGQFFVVKGVGLSERTVATYKEQLERVYPELGWLNVGAIRKEHVSKLITSLRERGYAEQTIKSTLVPVSRVFEYAKVWPNPVKSLDKDERPKPESREKRILTTEEIGKLIAAATPTYRPLIQTAIFTGMRQMEILGLVWSDVDFDAQTITVREQLSRTGGRKALKTRSKGRRTVYIPPFLVQVLREQKARSPFSKDSDYVFTTGSGKPFGWSNVDRQGLHKASERANLREPRPRFHDLRHTFVSIQIAQGRSSTYVANQIGDSVETTLRTYAHLFDAAEQADKARAAMEEAFGGNTQVMSGSETAEMAATATVTNIASVQGKRNRNGKAQTR